MKFTCPDIFNARFPRFSIPHSQNFQFGSFFDLSIIMRNFVELSVILQNAATGVN